MACFADINVSQGNEATYASCGGIFNMHLTVNLPKKLSSEKKILKSVKNNIDIIMVMSLWPRLFWPTLYLCVTT